MIIIFYVKTRVHSVTIMTCHQTCPKLTQTDESNVKVTDASSRLPQQTNIHSLSITLMMIWCVNDLYALIKIILST